ncbi:phosphatase PAP2 family protein [Nocardia sp. NPDC056000]|uniref:phosphatase PAP2 family protein n=1 Tax=Nocardia sp. NPDC056000 TaxID=3345674 RepID=UPI0035DF9ED8
MESSAVFTRPKPPRPAALGVLIALGLAVLALTIAVLAHPDPLGPDASWMRWFVEHRGDTATSLAKGISMLGGTAAMTLLAAVAYAVLLWGRRWETAVFVAITGLGAAALVYFGKLLIARPRPPLADRLVIETNHSYPSGHALGSIVVVGVVALLAARVLHGVWRALLLTVAALFVVGVGVSRIYLGVHWPTDVFAGWVFGILWLSLCFTFEPVLAERCRAVLARAARN